MSTSSNKQQKKGKDGMEMQEREKRWWRTVKDRRVQQMYVEGGCVKGMYATVPKSGVYVCVCCRIVRENAYVCVCMCVCVRCVAI